MKLSPEQSFPPYKALVNGFVRHELFMLEEGAAMHMPQPDLFADLAFGLYAFFKRDSHIGMNRLVQDAHIFALAREITYYCANSISVVMNHALKDQVSAHIHQIQRIFAEQRPALLLPDASTEDVRVWHEQMLAANALDIQQRVDFQAVLVEQIGNTFLEGMARFGELYNECSTPVEEAFLIGLFGLRDSWPRLLDSAAFTSHYAIGSYRVAFIIVDHHRRIAIDIESHSPDERTTEMGAADRARNRYLENEGWKILHFHRREIEMDLNRCIQIVNHTLKGLPLAGAL